MLSSENTEENETDTVLAFKDLQSSREASKYVITMKLYYEALLSQMYAKIPWTLLDIVMNVFYFS